MDIKAKETELFEKWANHLNQDVTEFCPNGGLLFRGKFFLNPIEVNGKYTWNREEGNEEELWEKALRRIMVLTKDLNDEELWDIRTESGGRNKMHKPDVLEEEVTYSGIGFYRKLNRWVYGIYNSTCLSYVPFNQVEDRRRMGEFYEQIPLVRINCKHEIGTSSIRNTDLYSAIQGNKDLLIEQIRIYEPNIILCCGYNKNETKTGNLILNFLIENIYSDLELIPKTEGWCYYSRINNIIAINSYHPTTTIDTDEGLYEGLVKNFSKALCFQHKVLNNEK